MRRGVRHLLLAAVLLLSSAAFRPARADEPTAAGALLTQAEAAFVDDSDCQRALPLFEGAYRLEPSWIALSGMAACHELQGELDVAYRLYRRILHDFGGELPARRQQRVEARLAELEPQLGTLILHVDPDDGSVTLSVDGEVVTSPVRLRPGSHVVTAAAPGRASASSTVTATAGVATEATLELPAPPPAPHPAPAQDHESLLPFPAPPAPHPASTARSPWLWRGVALSGVALAASGATLLVLAHRDFDAFDAQVAAVPGNPAIPARVDTDRLDAGRDKRDLGLVLAGVGVATVAGAVLLHFWPDARGHAVDVRASSGGLGLAAAWSY
jgi:hypothetical protein